MADPLVTLRAWRAQDARVLAAAWNDPTITAGAQPPDERSTAAAERWIEGCAVREQRLLAIDRVIAVDDACVGEVGLSSIDQRRKAALIGWWTSVEHRGNGYASAAVRAMTALAFDVFGLVTLVAEIGIENPGSVRVAEHGGFDLLRRGGEGLPHAYVCHHRGGTA
ncbi:MAG: GNAT family N-acetyltransferase [Acidimicrobiales bacterium]|nr:GNAT family N-acetyltransferase [Acidimicrobiales bacterium]MDG1876861.1 GNAT family N-acetyltransferase [Acidimicrobiales bacterium]